MMKLKKYFMGLLGAAALAACSSEDPVNTGGGNTPDATYGDQYVTVSIEMPTAPGSRAEGKGDNESDKFDDGNEFESKVNNVVFFFFDENDNVVDIQKLSETAFKKPGAGDINENPNIAKWGTVEVRLKAGLTYKKVATAINTRAADANALNSIKTLSDLEDRSRDYANDVTRTDNMGMVMSSSVYYEMTDYNTTPTADKKVCLVEITADNIYDSSQRPNIDALIAEGKKKYVDIFVERVVARIDVDIPEFDMKSYYISNEGNVESKTITVFDHATSTSQQIYVRPVIKGMVVNVLTPNTHLLKPLVINEVGYGNGNGDYKVFKWNDPSNKRSYWASTQLEDSDKMRYISWNDTEGENMTSKLSQYVNPNTQDFETTFGADGIRTNEGGSLNTKVMVVAELHKFASDAIDADDLGALSLVKFGTDYMLPDNLLSHAANLINIAVRTHEWKATDIVRNDVPLTEIELQNVIAVVNNSFLGGNDSGLNGGQFELDILNTSTTPGADWEAVIKQKAGFDFTLNNKDKEGKDILTTELLGLVKDQVTPLIANALEDVNKQAIYYWKDGKTYYYTNIRHQGFYGLVGNSTAENATDFLYGVVRNHIYNVRMTGIYGLGTPVIDPSKPIDPDRPKLERPSYIKARINIVPWRLVTNNATIH